MNKYKILEGYIETISCLKLKLYNTNILKTQLTSYPVYFFLVFRGVF